MGTRPTSSGDIPRSLADADEETPNLFWDPYGWCVDLREYRNYPIYGEGDWTLRTDNAGVGCRG